MAFSNQDLIDFFKQRMVELYDNNTLDSYSVRTCNTLSLFYEIKEVLEGWIACNVKNGETVSRCIDECIELLKKDEWLNFSFYDKEKLIKNLEEYQKNVASIKDSRKKKEEDNFEARYILHLVSLCISANNSDYISALISSIRDDLFTEKTYCDDMFLSVLQKLDEKLSLMATELMRRGYSKNYLYFFFKSIKQNEKGISFSDAFNQLESKFCAVHQYKDTVIIRLNFSKNSVPAMENMYDEVPIDYLDPMKDSLKGFFKKTPKRRFYIVTEDAVDIYSAMQKARLRLSQALDRNNMGAVHISNSCVVTYIKDGSPSLHKVNCFDERNGRNDLSSLPSIMRQIDDSDAISRDIKVRLNTAMRHLRVGDEQTEIEQQFLNYWIGLEFLFSTPRSGDSTFSRLMDLFPTIKALYYLKRNVSNLDMRLQEKKLLKSDDSFGNLSDSQIEDVFNGTSDILLKYRIKKMKSHLHSKDKVKSYLEKHIKNLEWHISRIYHYRNELVHEAAIKHNIESVANNLRSYLVFMLNLLLDYCDLKLQSPQSIAVAMDNFFWHYDLLWKKCTPEFGKEGFLAVSIPANHVK